MHELSSIRYYQLTTQGGCETPPVATTPRAGRGEKENEGCSAVSFSLKVLSTPFLPIVSACSRTDIATEETGKCDFPSNWVDLNSGLSLLPQISLHPLRVLVSVKPGIAGWLLYLNTLRTALGTGSVSKVSAPFYR